MAELPFDAAERADLLLNDPLLMGLFSRLESQYMSDIRSSKHADREAREIAFQRLKALDELRDDLKHIARDKSVRAYNRRQGGLLRLGT